MKRSKQTARPELAWAVNPRMKEALEHHHAGRLPEAESLYRAVLQSEPGHADAHHNLGVVAMQTNRPVEALPHLKAALEARPTQGQYWLSYIAALMQLGQAGVARQVLADGRQRGLAGPEVDKLEERLGTAAVPQPRPEPAVIAQGATLFAAGRYADVEALARPLTEAFPAHGPGWQLLGLALKQMGRGEEALVPMARAVALMPANAEVHYNLALLNKETGRLAAAESSYRNALALQPGLAAAHNNLGVLLQSQGRFGEAEASFQQVLALRPEYVEAHNNLAVVLQQQGRLGEAEASFRRALALNPDSVDALNGLGKLYRDHGRHQEAETCIRRALAVRPEDVTAHVQLATLLVLQGQPAAAENCYRQAIALVPESAELHNSLGAVLFAQEHYSAAAAAVRRALVLQPDLVDAHYNLGIACVELGDPVAAEASCRRALALRPDYAEAYDNLLFALNYAPDASEAVVFRAYEEFEARFGAPYRGAWRAHANDRSMSRRLKVGYVSPDFKHHSVGRFLEPLLAGHDKSGVELYGYAELQREDDSTQRYRGYMDHWRSTLGLSDDALAEQIRADEIDILVDVAGHTRANRLGVFARKPAPVSVTWLGYAYTTGLRAIDYFLADEVSTPVGTEQFYSETLWRLAGPGLVYRPTQDMGEVSALPASVREGVTFGSLTRAVRINERVIRAWAAILSRVPGSRLVIDSANYQDEPLSADLVERFARHGVARERLELGYHTPPWDVLRDVDIGLDCFPHNSGTTLFESLYMGVPFVTLAGRISPRRLGSSILTGVGHPEWIAQSEEEYVEKVVALAENLPKLAEIRAQLRSEMTASPLMDEAGFARKLEAAYRDMFKQWADGGRSA